MSQSIDREEFLKQPNIAVLATADRRGRPHAMPMWYLYEDGVFIMSTGLGSQKHRNIEHNGEAMVVFDQRTLPYYAVMAQCTAEVTPGVSPDMHRKLATRYLGEEGARKYLARRGDGDSATIRLKPRKFIEYHGISGRS